MNRNHVTDRIEAFVRSQFAVSASDRRFNRSVDIFELGYVDSLGFVELIEFLQNEFNVEIPEAVLLSDEFLSIEGMARCLDSLNIHCEQPHDHPNSSAIISTASS